MRIILSRELRLIWQPWHLWDFLQNYREPHDVRRKNYWKSYFEKNSFKCVIFSVLCCLFVHPEPDHTAPESAKRVKSNFGYYLKDGGLESVENRKYSLFEYCWTLQLWPWLWAMNKINSIVEKDLAIHFVSTSTAENTCSHPHRPDSHKESHSCARFKYIGPCMVPVIAEVYLLSSGHLKSESTATTADIRRA